MHSSSLSFLELDEACAAIESGASIIFPTETFYALGCDAMNADAVGGIFSIKKRSLSMPLPVVIGTREHLDRVAAYVPDAAVALMDAFWPGSLSIVLPANPEVPELLTANAGRIAVRFSPHPAVLQLCNATDKVLVASSANISGFPSSADLERLDPEIVGGSSGIYAFGPKPAGVLPSTVVDVFEKREGPLVRVLRSGVISVDDIKEQGFAVRDISHEEV